MQTRLPTDVNTRVDQNPSIDLLHFIAIGYAGALSIGLILARILLNAGFLSDPYEVVGVPIIEGYSERSEQFAYLLFWASSLIVPGLLLLLRKHLPAGAARWAGLCMIFALPTISMAVDVVRLEPTSLAMVAVTTIGLTWLTNTRPNLLGRIRNPELLAWTMVFVVLLARRFWPWLAVFEVPAVSLAACIGGGTVAYVLYRIPELRETMLVQLQRLRTSHRSMLVLAAISLPLMSRAELFALPLIFGYCIATCFATSLPHLRSLPANSSLVCMCAGLSIAAAWMNWNLVYLTTFQQVLIHVLIAIAVTVSVLLRQDTGKTVRAIFNSRSLPTVISVTAAILVMLTAVATHRWWTSVVTVIIIAVIFRIRRPSPTVALILSGLIFAAFIPSISDTRPADPYHEGQVISAVWEVQNGRELYTEVFPLRGFAFYTTMLAHTVLPPTIEVSRAANLLLRYLPLAGGVLIGYSWTRSLPWALAFGLAIGTQPMLPRQGALLILAALVMEILRLDRRSRWWLLLVPDIACCLYGFDGIGPVGLAACGAVLLAPFRLFESLKSDSLRTGLTDALIVGSAFVLPFFLLLTVMISPQAGRDYWTLLVTYSRHLNAFYGLPVAFSNLVELKGVASTLVLLPLWNVCYVCNSGQLSASRRRMWLFVSMFIFLWTQRAVGRSDVGHYDCAIYPSIVLSLLLLFEFLSLTRRLGNRSVATDRGVAACVITVVCAIQIEYRSSTPQTLIHQIQSLPTADSLKPAADPYVLNTVAEDEYFWPVDNGLSTFVHQRHNPTRHAIAYAMGSPTEQRLAVAAMQENPPRLIQLATKVKPQMDLLQYYVVSQHILGSYRPTDSYGYLEPNHGTSFESDELPDWLTFSISCGRLPHEWGSRRLPELLTVPTKLDFVEDKSSVTSRGHSWKFQRPPRTAQHNYLVAIIRCNADSESREWPQMAVALTDPQPNRLQQPSLVFHVNPDGQPREYMIPVGCSPQWCWNSSASQIELISSDARINVEQCSAIYVDEMW